MNPTFYPTAAWPVARSAAMASVALLTAISVTQPAEAARKQRASEVSDAKRDKSGNIPDGTLHIIVNISTQKVSVYSDGVLAARSNVATGVAGHPTPTGVFSIIGKSRHHASNIYSGAPMPFMQRVTWSGIAMHQGVVPGGRPASHGCIRLPGDFAAMMFGTTKIGARVIIANSEVTPSEFSHAALFAPKPKSVLVETEQKPVTPTKTAEVATDTKSDAPPAIAETDVVMRDLDAQETRKELAPSNALVSVFISAKEKRLFIRQNFLPIFDTPVTIKDAGQPIGTHVFTSLAGSEPGKLRWIAVTVPDNLKPKAPAAKTARGKDKDEKPAEPEKASTAAEALDRLEIPAEVRARIEDIFTAGGTFIVSDRGLGEETGEGTDFVVLTR